MRRPASSGIGGSITSWARGLPEGLGRDPKTEKLGKGVNDFGEPRYGGPADVNKIDYV